MSTVDVISIVMKIRREFEQQLKISYDVVVTPAEQKKFSLLALQNALIRGRIDTIYRFIHATDKDILSLRCVGKVKAEILIRIRDHMAFNKALGHL